MNPIEVLQKEHLRVSLSSITRLVRFTWLSHLDNNDIRHDVTFMLVQSRIDFGIIDLLTPIADRFEQEWFRVELWVDAENVEHDSRGGTVVACSDDVAVANDEE